MPHDIINDKNGQQTANQPEAGKYTYLINKEDEGVPVKELLRRRMGFSSRLLRRLKKCDGVFLDGTHIKLCETGKEGQRITIKMPEEQSQFEPAAIPLDVIYEDDELLIINKQPGIVVHPTRGHYSHTIANGIMYYMQERGESYKIRFFNRLDMDTSGVLLTGKNSHGQDHFMGQQEKGGVVKKYNAFVRGIVEKDSGTIDLPIDKLSDDDPRRGVTAGGYPSVTHYKVLERYERGYTLLELILETGRTHQIRVHLAHIGHPVLGDTLYSFGEPDLIDRQALHAAYLSFDHPSSGRRIEAVAPFPEDMKKLIEKVRK